MNEQINRAAEFNLDSVIYSSLASLIIRRKNVAQKLLENNTEENTAELTFLNNAIKDLLAL